MRWAVITGVAVYLEFVIGASHICFKLVISCHVAVSGVSNVKQAG